MSGAKAMGAPSSFARYASLVKLSHTIFAAPFAASALVLSLRGPHLALTAGRVAAIVGCLVCARTAAMAYNRLVDRDVDAVNPRTKDREIPSGAVSVTGAVGLTVFSAVGFVVFAWSLGRLPAILAIPVLLFLLGYSHAKRFTWAAHLWLGLALALAPGGVWLAMGATPSWGIVALMGAVATWVAGFDVLYSLQDERFDRAHGLSSIPARFGALGALTISRLLHLVTVFFLTLSGILFRTHGLFYLAVAVVGSLLVYEHRLVRPTKQHPERVDLSRLDKAFFDLNGWISLSFFGLVWLDYLTH